MSSPGHTLVPPDMVADLERAIAHSVPRHLREGFTEYLLRGRPTGSFLEALIAGDLFDAVVRADPMSGAWIDMIARVLVQFAPADAWGSREKYQAWIERGREERRGEC